MIRIRLSRVLGEKRIRMSELARRAGVSRNTLSALYNERADGIMLDTLDRICAVLGVQPGDLLEWEPDQG